jgi:hypothetical protein
MPFLHDFFDFENKNQDYFTDFKKFLDIIKNHKLE